MPLTNVYRLNEGSGAFSATITNTFDRCIQEENQETLTFPISTIKYLMWCINAVGYVTLKWEMKNGDHATISVLSGNGRWDLNTLGLDFKAPAGSTGKVLLSTKGFDDLDSYTIILAGSK